ncbi:MAG: peptidoglycan-binding protein [Defluviitaleaceae bacterium]|nr:peptidoglycan-binding protein [Defluviitaleaceae bacterium]
MGKGFLRIQTVTANGAIIVPGASITIMDENGQKLYELTTDETGHAPEVALDAPEKSYMEEPDPPARSYYTYKILVKAKGFTPVAYEGVMIFDTVTSILKVELDPIVPGHEDEVLHYEINGHKLDQPVSPFQQVDPPPLDGGINALVLPEVTIPNFIRVHLGRMERPSTIVSVPFIDYIKNVTSHEIYDDWPEQALIANIYCIVSLTLNRVFTEFYRKRGFNYDITSETYMDQKFVYRGAIGARINAVVDRIFNQYLAIIGHQEPFLSLYNDGVRVNIPGRLSQWGSFYDARDRGMNAWQIITKYFKQNLELRTCDRFGGILESYPGYTLTAGTRGEVVRTMQLYLNRILGRYTNQIINPVDGIYGQQTRASVITFQRLYNLPQTGNIDRRTWYEISRIYAIEKALWEMYSEGERIGIGKTPHTQVIRTGSVGPLVVELQFLLDFIAMYHNEIPFVPQTSRFDSLTDQGVRAFQRLFGITADGIVGATTWRKLYDVYWGIRESGVTPQPPECPNLPENIPPFPGVSLTVGSAGANVQRVQEAINRLAEVTPGLWRITEDGIFGNGTREAVMAFQRMYGLAADGVVGPITWRRLMEEAYCESPYRPGIPPFPGTNLSVGSRGDNVRLIQQAINTLAPCYPGRLWPLSADGVFGNITRDAIFAFQSIFGLPITGIVGQATWDRLMREAANADCGGGTTPPPPIPPFPGTNLSVGSRGENVRLVQQAINTLAPRYPGRLWTLTADGVFGNMTRDAIFAFQSIFGLPITGIVGQVTWDRLMREAANAGQVAAQEESEQSAQYESLSRNLPRNVNNAHLQQMMRIMFANKIFRSFIR